MKINFDRICRLAGVESRQERKTRLTEGTDHSHDHMKSEKHDMYHEEDEGMYREENEGMFANEMEEYDEADSMFANEMEEDPLEEDPNEIIEVDPKELMEEIRRAKKIIALKENKARKSSLSKQQLQENHLKNVIRKEIQNIMNEIEEVDNSWVYGNKKPRNSKKGYTNHGRTLPGIGFSKKW